MQNPKSCSVMTRHTHRRRAAARAQLRPESESQDGSWLVCKFAAPCGPCAKSKAAVGKHKSESKILNLLLARTKSNENPEFKVMRADAHILRLRARIQNPESQAARGWQGKQQESKVQSCNEPLNEIGGTSVRIQNPKATSKLEKRN